MHFQSDMKQQKQNETHAHSAFSEMRDIKRPIGDWKTFQPSGAWSPTWQFIALDFYAEECVL